MRNLNLGPKWKADSKFPGCYFSTDTIEEFRKEQEYWDKVDELSKALRMQKDDRDVDA